MTRSGADYPGGVARVTLQTIADRVGVSRMTVSNAFSRPDQLSEARRGTILEAAQQLGYVGPDPAARALARGTTGAVGVLLTSSLRYELSVYPAFIALATLFRFRALRIAWTALSLALALIFAGMFALHYWVG